MKIIRRFSRNCNKEMDADKKVRFRGIGLLYKDENGNIQFDQDTQINYLPDAFGLSSFNSPVIYRNERARPFSRTQGEAAHITLQKRKWIRRLKWAAVLIPLLAIGTWSVLNRDAINQQYEKYAYYFAPITGDSQAEALSREELEQQLKEKKQSGNSFEVNQSAFLPSSSHSSNTMAKEEAPTEKATPERPAEKVAEKANTPAASQKNVSDNRNRNYYIITGSFLDDTNAQQHIHELKNIGFAPTMAGKNQYGYYRVAAVRADKRQEALDKLRFIRREDFADAWLLVK
jgi:hypothetical protein